MTVRKMILHFALLSTANPQVKPGIPPGGCGERGGCEGVGEGGSPSFTSALATKLPPTADYRRRNKTGLKHFIHFNRAWQDLHFELENRSVAD